MNSKETNATKTLETQSSEVQPEQVESLSKKSRSTHWPFDNGSFAPFQSLRREVDDIFNQFTGRFGVLPHRATELLQTPPLDVDETEKTIEILAELPGVAEEDIDVFVTDSVLTIHGEKQHRKEQEDADHRISECSYGVFERSLSLPFSCDAKTIDASYDNGVLHLVIPKPEKAESKAQKVKVKTAA